MRYHAKEVFYGNLDGLLFDMFKQNKPSYWKILKYIVKISGSTDYIPALKTCENDMKPSIFADKGKAEHLIIS